MCHLCIIYDEEGVEDSDEFEDYCQVERNEVVVDKIQAEAGLKCYL